MSTINIKFDKPFRSIQTGFEWSNIPMLAIITGVNGAGKTHLIDTLNQPSQNKYTTIAEVNNRKIRLILPQNSNNFSYDGLVHYFTDMPNRLNQEKAHLQNINRFKQQIQQREEQHKGTTSEISKKQLQQQINEFQHHITNTENNIGGLYIYPYEEELKRIASLKENVKLEELTIKDIEEHAIREFAKITEIEDLSRYVFDIEHQIALRTLDKHSQGNLQGAGEEYNRERVYEKINRLFIKYGFDYFVMPDPFSFDDNKNMLLGRPQATRQSNRSNPHTIKIRFEGRRGEIVEYGELSKGEQMIVKFTVWAMAKDQNGMQINTMLLDEPDAHLHPSMCKMMIDILTELSKPKREGGSGIRIIMTTHSPSTVAFAPEGSLFVMEKDDDGIRSIRSTSSSEAMSVLSSGIFTYDKAVRKFTQAADSPKSNLLFVEGPTDVPHLKKAIEMLECNLDIDIIDIHDAGALGSFIRSTPSFLFGEKKMIALFDRDDEGGKAYKPIIGGELFDGAVKHLTAKQCNGRSYALKLVAPSNIAQYCPIEFLYPYQYLADSEMLVEMNYGKYQDLYKTTDPTEQQTNLDEYKSGITLKSYCVDDNNKTRFVEKIKNETSKDVFEGFRPTLELIKKIIEL